MAMSEFEVTLVTAAKSGNSKAFEELYNIYNNKIFALARMTVKNEADAEDVLQQTFINTWRNLKSLSNPTAFTTWIQKIALNECYKILRKKNIAILLDAEGEIENIGEDEPDGELLPSVYAERDDLRARMGKIIDGLSEVQKQTVLLYYFNELKVEEISYVMECTVGTVKTRLFLARKAIRSEVEEQERKSGEKFYGIAGIPMLSLGNLLTQLFEAQTIAPTASANILSGISNAITQGAIDSAQTASSIAGTSTAGAAGVSGNAAGATTAGAAGASGGAAGVSLTAKIIIVIIATTVLVCGGILVWNAVRSPAAPEMLDGAAISHEAPDGTAVDFEQTPTQAPPEPDDITLDSEEDFLQYYAPVLDEYRSVVLRALDDNTETFYGSRDEWWAVASSALNAAYSAENPTDEFGYALKDLNKNGIPDLILLSRDYVIYAIYSLVDYEPYQIISGTEYGGPTGIGADGTVTTIMVGGGHMSSEMSRISQDGTGFLLFLALYSEWEYALDNLIFSKATLVSDDPPYQYEHIEISEEEFEELNRQFSEIRTADAGLTFIPLFGT